MSELEEPPIAAFNTLIDAHMYSKATAVAASLTRTNSQPNRGRGGNGRGGQGGMGRGGQGQSDQQNRQPILDAEKKRRQIVKGKCFHLRVPIILPIIARWQRTLNAKSVIMSAILQQLVFSRGQKLMLLTIKTETRTERILACFSCNTGRRPKRKRNTPNQELLVTQVTLQCSLFPSQPKCSLPITQTAVLLQRTQNVTGPLQICYCEKDRLQ